MQKKVTINYMGIDLDVIGEYEEAVEAIQYDSDMNGYPGDDALFEAHTIYVSDSEINIIEMLINLQLNEIEDLVLIKLEE
jgi:hypothetical protein